MSWDAVIHNVALFVLIGFLCWLFNTWWPVALIIFVAQSAKKGDVNEQVQRDQDDR